MTRSELYALVWSTPASQLAERLGLSGKGLAKLCARHDIPLPWRGYWQKFEAGHRPIQTPLPARLHDETISRFRLLDAQGRPLPITEEVQWVIPGLLKVAASGSRATFDVVDAPTQADAVSSDASENSAQQVDQERDPTTSVAHTHTVSEARAPLRSANSATQLQVERVGPNPLLQVGLESVLALGPTFQRHQAARELLAAVAMRAIEEGQYASTELLEWVAAMKARLDDGDPVRTLIAIARTGQAT